VFFKSWRDRFENVRALEACRATSAAPTYFEPAHVDLDGGVRTLVDGGVFINSPAVSAYAEAIKLFPGEDFQLLSLGTGELTRTLFQLLDSGFHFTHRIQVIRYSNLISSTQFTV